jgi:CRISPR-associated protein Csm5
VRYRVTCLTPVLVGDGRKLAPIDYMVWRDQVNVLDQRRIFQLLSRGPRLDGYLAQLRRAEKLDFASWGGFAQNFAGRRIPFEHPSCAAHWERAHADALHIPSFAAGLQGPFLPASALRGALRTGLVFAGLKTGSLDKVAALFKSERPPRRPAEFLEERVLGSGGASRMRFLQLSDSGPVPVSSLKVFLLRVASLRSRGRDGFELGWKQSQRGATDGRRPEEGTASFAEMASPGAVFEGSWQENQFLTQPEILRALNWREPMTRATLFEAANSYAMTLLDTHKRYTESAGLPLVQQDLERLESRLAEVRQSGNACLLPLGWGGGLLAHVAWLKTEDPVYREIIEQTRLYSRSMFPGLPFPKTRRIVFLEDRPATLPGWALLEVAA